MTDLEKKIDKEFKHSQFIDYSKLDSFIISEITQALEATRLEKKSVEELEYTMGTIYNTVSLKVAYKEGYNRGISNQDKLIIAYLEGLNKEKE